MKIIKVISLFFIATLIFFLPSSSQADELEELENQLQETRQRLSETQQQLEGTKSDLQQAVEEQNYYKGALNSYTGRLNYARSQLNQVTLELEKNLLELQEADQKYEETLLTVAYLEKLLGKVVRRYYMDSYIDEVALLVAGVEQGEVARIVTYRGTVTDNYRGRFAQILKELNSIQQQKQELESTKQELENNRISFEQQKLALERQINSTTQQLAGAQGRESELISSLTGLEQQAASLSAKEQEILQAKAAAALASTTVGNEEIIRAAIEANPPPDGGRYFSFWTYGYPHRVGMNQYGAYGRSKAGQDAHQILTAYYAGTQIEERTDLPETIRIITGSGEAGIDFEDNYLKGIGEMPSCWGTPENRGYEALKAQVIAARSYALATTNMGANAICTDQKCQVYVGESKINGACGEYWEQAVEDTRGQVVVHSGQIIPAWYASTAGGFTLSSQEVWGSARPYAVGIADIDAQSFPYDGPQWGDSPWYHKSWGDQPWLSREQMADLFNAALLPDSYNGNLPLPVNGGFSSEEIKNRLQQEGITPVENVNAVETVGHQSKATSTVRVYLENGQAREVDAQRFRFVFNLRSPGTDAIWTSRFDVVTSG